MHVWTCVCACARVCTDERHDFGGVSVWWESDTVCVHVLYDCVYVKKKYLRGDNSLYCTSTQIHMLCYLSILAVRGCIVVAPDFVLDSSAPHIVSKGTGWKDLLVIDVGW
jgi:hypothetical protein